jgi:hypothetical protein
MIFTASGNNCVSNQAVCFKQLCGMEYPTRKRKKGKKKKRKKEKKKKQSIN